VYSTSSCNPAVKVIGCIEDPVVIQIVLTHLKAEAETNAPNRLSESRAPPAAFDTGCCHPQGTRRGIGWPEGRIGREIGVGEDWTEQKFQTATGCAAFCNL